VSCLSCCTFSFAVNVFENRQELPPHSLFLKISGLICFQGGQVSEHPKQKMKMEEQSGISLSFIQVCQYYVDDYRSSDWRYLCPEPFLKNILYEAGITFYTFPKTVL